jgi:hypothetical protein
MKNNDILSSYYFIISLFFENSRVTPRFPSWLNIYNSSFEIGIDSPLSLLHVGASGGYFTVVKI